MVALKENEHFQKDLASFQSLETTKGNRGNKFLLVAIDVYSRKIYGAPVTGKDGPTIRAALQDIFAKAKPKVLGTDAGNEWKNPEVAEYLQQQGVQSSHNWSCPRERLCAWLLWCDSGAKTEQRLSTVLVSSAAIVHNGFVK